MSSKRPLFFLFGCALAGAVAAAFAAACASTDAGTAQDTDASSDGSTTDRRPPTDDGSATTDAGTPSTCALTRVYTTTCAGADQLNCGDSKFDAWCDLNDKAINSAAFRRAEALCLTSANCDSMARRDCEYKSYITATPTAAQTQVATAYCQTCEPADVSGCVNRKTIYKPALGPKSTDDVFVAAWELADPVADAIRTSCTGAALDAGGSPDAGTCLKAFANCAGGIYLDRVPDCP